MNLNNLKKTLNELEKNGIYEHKQNNPYKIVFTSIYEKEEIINFLRRNTNLNDKDLKYIY